MDAISTRVKDSKISAAYLDKLIADNPVKAVVDVKTGLPNGNFLTGPTRLSFCDQLFKSKPNDQGVEQFGTSFLFPLGVILDVLSQAATQAVSVTFPQNMTANGFNWSGIHSPFHDQGEKTAKYSGYLPGAYYFGSSTLFKPRVVDLNMNDIVDEKRVYPGVWAIGAVNTYTYNKKKKGVGFGLQSVIIIGDDSNIGGGKGGNPAADFAGIAVQQNTKISDAFTSAVAGVMPLPGMQSAEDQMRAMGLM